MYVKDCGREYGLLRSHRRLVVVSMQARAVNELMKPTSRIKATWASPKPTELAVACDPEGFKVFGCSGILSARGVGTSSQH